MTKAKLSNDLDGNFSFLIANIFGSLLKKYTKRVFFKSELKNVCNLKTEIAI